MVFIPSVGGVSGLCLIHHTLPTPTSVLTKIYWTTPNVHSNAQYTPRHDTLPVTLGVYVTERRRPLLSGFWPNSTSLYWYELWLVTTHHQYVEQTNWVNPVASLGHLYKGESIVKKFSDQAPYCKNGALSAHRCWCISNYFSSATFKPTIAFNYPVGDSVPNRHFMTPDLYNHSL